MKNAKQSQSNSSLSLSSIISMVLRVPWTMMNAWDEFFYARTSNIKAIASLRLAYAIVDLVNLSLLSLDFEFFMKVLPTHLSVRTMDPDTETIFTLFPRDGDGTPMMYMNFCLFLWFQQTILLGLGIAPRFNAFGCFFWHVNFAHHNNLLWDGEDNVLRLLAFFLIFFPPTGSIFEVFNSKTTEDLKKSSFSWPMWPFRLMQIEMCLIFFSTGMLKISGPRWANGTAMTFVVQVDDLYGGYFNPDWLFGYERPLRFVTYATMALELTAPILLWFRKTRFTTLLLVTMFHWGIDASMNLNMFHFIMIVGWWSFIIQPDGYDNENSDRQLCSKERKVMEDKSE